MEAWRPNEASETLNTNPCVSHSTYKSVCVSIGVSDRPCVSHTTYKSQAMVTHLSTPRAHQAGRTSSSSANRQVSTYVCSWTRAGRLLLHLLRFLPGRFRLIFGTFLPYLGSQGSPTFVLPV
jgi:hypothetical protein